MSAEKLIVLIYIAISVLSFCCVLVTTAAVDDIFFGLLYLWICFTFFCIFEKRKNIIAIKGGISKKTNRGFRIKNVLLASFVCVAGVIFAVKFYTGKSPFGVINSLRSGSSVYQSYQNYFVANGLAFMRWQKIPAVLSNIFLEFVFIYSYINVIIIDNRRKKDIALLVIATGAKMYFGIARGTNFEMFEIAFLAIYCYWTRKATQTQKRKRIILMVVGTLFCVLAFDLVITMRGMHGNHVWISQEIYTDENSEIVHVFPAFSKIIGRLGAYFSFGTFFTSYYFNHFLFDNIGNFIAGLIPFGNLMVEDILPNTTSTAHLQSLCWTPDIFFVIKYFGVMGGVIVYSILGILYNRLQILTDKNEKDAFVEMLKFFVIYEMFSMPIGNFVWISSPTRITFLLTLFELIIGRRIKFYPVR